MSARYESAEWLEWSGLPAELNRKPGTWATFKKIVELDCKLNRQPDAVQVSLGELAARLGMDWEKVATILGSLRKKKYLACFIPDNPDEPGLFQVRVPIATPKSPDEVARTSNDPHMRDAAGFRYSARTAEAPLDESKVQKIVDLYLNSLSQKMNSFIVDEIEILARRFPLDEIEKAIQRAARHEIRSIGWVAKELIRDQSRKKKPKKSPD
ncbi:hypothetical protein HY256_12530 [Candidatus Sumerlaeota bacterium]|nr:hypothetical protein [Candidatus Sumerlaeota bacterium]